MTYASPSDDVARPWAAQLTQSIPEPWAHGRGILALSGAMCLWYASLILRFTEGTAFAAAALWWVALLLWLALQTWFARAHLPERYAFLFSTLLQALVPTIATLALVRVDPGLKAAALAIATGVSVTELIAIQILRLAAWGTIVKYRQGQLPRYFYLYGSIPDFGFALLTVALTGWLVLSQSALPSTLLVLYSAVGIGAFMGAALTMYFGVPGTVLSWRWPRVEAGTEAPTFLPFRWPMNLAPSFCGPVFWLAHGLLIAKVWAM